LTHGRIDDPDVDLDNCGRSIEKNDRGIPRNGNSGSRDFFVNEILSGFFFENANDGVLEKERIRNNEGRCARIDSQAKISRPHESEGGVLWLDVQDVGGNDEWDQETEKCHLHSRRATF
jgi:hypothetical protein